MSAWPRLRGMMARARSGISDLSMTERVVLAAVAGVHLVAIDWGLPAAEGWDVDGVAPRDFLPGIIQTLTPGEHFTYPPFHLLLLTFLTLPVTLIQLLRTPSLAPSDVITTFRSVAVMTIFAAVARLVSCLMSLGIVVVVGRLANTIFGTRSARAWAMAIAGFEVAGTYYGHTTNLDIPALFWASLTISVLVDALVLDEPRRLRRVGVLAACAIASKDQAYAVFVVTLPAAILSWLTLRPRGARKELLLESIRCAAITVGLVLVVDGALFNPTGFAARVRFLTGPASQDFAQHARDMNGRLAVVRDAIAYFPNHYPVVVAPLLLIGVVLATVMSHGRKRIAAVTPLLVAASFTVAFNCVARRVEERFLLPQMQMLAVYGGCIGLIIDRLVARRQAAFAHAVRLAGAAVVLLCLRQAARVPATMLGDARYDAERYIRDNVRPSEVIEIYGSHVYLPRLPRTLDVEHVDPRPLKSRNMLPGVTERQDLLSAIETRRPRWIVIGMGYAWRYLQPERTPTSDGRVLPDTQKRNIADTDSRNFFHALVGGNTNYALVHTSHCTTSPLLPPIAIHASLATPVLIFRRKDVP